MLDKLMSIPSTSSSKNERVNKIDNTLIYLLHQAELRRVLNSKNITPANKSLQEEFFERVKIDK